MPESQWYCDGSWRKASDVYQDRNWILKFGSNPCGSWRSLQGCGRNCNWNLNLIPVELEHILNWSAGCADEGGSFTGPWIPIRIVIQSQTPPDELVMKRFLNDSERILSAWSQLAKPSQAKLSQANSNQTNPSQAQSNQARPNQAKLSQAERSQAKSSQDQPNQARASQAKPN